MKQAILFFAEHAGYCTPPGRMACAKALAVAENQGEALGLTVTWEYDGDADTSWMDKHDLRRLENGALEAFMAYVEGDGGEVLASLGGIFLHVDSSSDRRVYEAELYQEAIAEIKKGSVQ